MLRSLRRRPQQRKPVLPGDAATLGRQVRGEVSVDRRPGRPLRIRFNWHFRPATVTERARWEIRKEPVACRQTPDALAMLRYWCQQDTSKRNASTCAPRPRISAAALSSASCCTSAMTRYMPRAASTRLASSPKQHP
jgi:hypothetical protein